MIRRFKERRPDAIERDSGNIFLEPHVEFDQTAIISIQGRLTDALNRLANVERKLADLNRRFDDMASSKFEDKIVWPEDFLVARTPVKLFYKK